jgi:pimeloyl-ACP methyl ester carboxylesterase
MVVLFIHGMGRSPLSGWPMLRQLQHAGFKAVVFGYVAALESFNSIVSRLRTRIQRIAEDGPYIVVGHSLGGVLLRQALYTIAKGTAPPRHVYLLGSPVRSSRLARKLQSNPVFRLLAGDCGQMLASDERMAQVNGVAGAVTAIIGVRGFTRGRSPFGSEPNDGIVSISEASADWLKHKIEVPVMHTFLPASSLVARIIINEHRLNVS